MAPHTSSVITREYTEEKVTRKEKYKLMKPVIEKKRRDRINHSIEQLKTLLGREFQNQEPNMKLEKADILEMTVNFLKLHNQRLFTVTYTTSLTQNYNEGYSRCLQEIQQFSFAQESKNDIQRKLVTHLHGAQNPPVDPCDPAPALPAVPHQPDTANKQTAHPSTKVLWRPW
ncbi:transcription factor HES-5 [Callorhinchus milii]|nr:transcription factor HES-5 [Callorhinchus milii]